MAQGKGQGGTQDGRKGAGSVVEEALDGTAEENFFGKCGDQDEGGQAKELIAQGGEEEHFFDGAVGSLGGFEVGRHEGPIGGEGGPEFCAPREEGEAQGEDGPGEEAVNPRPGTLGHGGDEGFFAPTLHEIEARQGEHEESVEGLTQEKGAAGAGFGACDNVLNGHAGVAKKLKGFRREKTGQQGARQDG